MLGCLGQETFLVVMGSFHGHAWYLRVVRPVFGNIDVSPNGEFELFWNVLNMFVT